MSEDPAKYGNAPEDLRIGRPPSEPSTPVGEQFEEMRKRLRLSISAWNTALGIGRTTYEKLRRGEFVRNRKALLALAEKLAARPLKDLDGGPFEDPSGQEHDANDPDFPDIDAGDMERGGKR